MHQDLSQQAYCQSVGTNSTNYPVIDKRNPTVNDIYYPIGKFWINQTGPNQSLWYLNSLSNATGTLQALWIPISIETVLATLSDTGNANIVPPSLSSASPPDNIQIIGGTGITVVGNASNNSLTITNTSGAAETLTGNDGVAVSASGGTIQTLGNVVASGTHSGYPLYTFNPSSNIEQWDIQVASAISSTNIDLTGLAAFNNTQFAVDSNGFVTLYGGSGAPTLGITPNAHTSPGTSPVVPNASGDIIIEGGATFATGTQANPIRTNSLAANTIDLQIQLAGSHAATSTANDFGVAQFDSNSFGVTSGFVTLKNGGTTGAVTSVIGDDSNPVVPASGAITFEGTVVANATNAKPVYFLKGATSTEELEVQLTTTSTSGSKNINNAGLASFDSAAFTVDSATGFVSLVGGSAPAVETLTGNTGGAISPSSGNIGTVGTGSITIVGSGHTLTTELTGLTQYDILVGQGSTTIGLVVPSATSGVPLISQGSSSYPVFGTAVVAGGGTGATTLTGVLIGNGTSAITGNAITQYDVLVGGASNAITSISPSTSGYVLTSNGPGENPTFQAVGASSITLDGDSGSASGSTITISGGTSGLTTTATIATMDITGTLNVSHGGTGATTLTGVLTGNGTSAITASSVTQYDVLVGGASNAISSVGPGTSGQVLQSGGGSGNPAYSTATYPSSTTVNQILYSSSNNTIAGLATGNNGVLITSSGGVPSILADGTTGQVLTATTGSPPSWTSISVTGISTLDGDSGSCTGSTVTISGGSTGLTTSASSATMDLTGTLNVGHGGTGDTSFTAYSVICGGTTSTGALQNVSGLGTSGYVLTSNGPGELPSWQNAGDNALAITMDAGTSPISPSSGALVFTGAQVASGVVGTNVIRTDGSASNTMTLQIQRSTTAGSSTVSDNGVCHFSSTEFSVDSNGFVTSNNITLVAGTGITLSPSTGLVTLGGSITISSTGSALFNYKNVNHGSSPYTVLSTDQYLSVDCSGGTVTLDFPNTPTTYQVWYVKDRTGNASTNNISITTVGGTDTIDGQTTYKIVSNYGAVNLIYNGTNYEIF